MSETTPAEPPRPAPTPWAALIISLCVVALYAVGLIAPAIDLAVSERQSVLLDFAMTTVLAYWLGSSNGSRVKDAVLAAVRR